MLKHFLDSQLVKRYARMRVMWQAMRDVAESRKGECDSLRKELSQLDRRLAATITELAEANSQKAALKHELQSARALSDISDKQIELLASVVLRDRERVLAETAVYAQLKDGNRDLVNPTSVMARQVANANG